MIGLGLGIDYALLTVSRFREALADGQRTAAGRRGGRAAGGLDDPPLRVPGLDQLRRAADDPALGAALGRLRGPARHALRAAALGDAPARGAVASRPAHRRACASVRRGRRRQRAAAREAWRRWGMTRDAPPGAALSSSRARRFSCWRPRRGGSTRRCRSATGCPRARSPCALTTASTRWAGRTSCTRCASCSTFPPGVTLEAPEGWAAATRLYERAAPGRPRVERVQCLPGDSSTGPTAPRSCALLSPGGAPHARRGRRKRHALRGRFPAATPDARANRSALARELRTWNADGDHGPPGRERCASAASPAFDADYEDTVARALPPGHRCSSSAARSSRSSPDSARCWSRSRRSCSNLLSVGAAFGALVLVFQEGYGARWLGLAGPTGSVFPIIPVLVFCIVFGLSMDYEVILVARVAEARRAGFGESRRDRRGPGAHARPSSRAPRPS